MSKYISLTNIIVSIIVFAAAAALLFAVRKCARKYVNRDSVTGKLSTNTHFVVALIRYTVWMIAVVTVLQINGIKVSSLITALGVAGIIVGFALQDILKDLIMGTSLVWDRFFAVGDVVRYKNIEGKVTYFNIKTTKIYDINTGNTFTVCNRNISEIEKISDWVDVRVPAGYGEDKDRVRSVCGRISDIAAEFAEVDSCDFLGTDEFADSCIYYRLRVHCAPELKPGVRRKILGLIQDEFDKEGISIPYNRLEVHML